MTNETRTDAALLAAAIARAGSVRELAEAVGVSRVTLWRWQAKGLVPKARDRRVLERYMEAE